MSSQGGARTFFDKWTRENSCYILTKNLLTFFQVTTGELIIFSEELSPQHLAVVWIGIFFFYYK